MASKEKPDTRQIGLTMQIFAWLIFIIIVGLYFDDLLKFRINPNSTPTSRLGEDGSKEVLLRQNQLGHYVASGEINGVPVVFLVDTGATGVAIPNSLAKALAIPIGRALNTKTAAGNTIAYLSQLDTVRVGQIVLRNVEAAVVPEMESDYILLGMSFLTHIELIQKDGLLTLRQKN